MAKRALFGVAVGLLGLLGAEPVRAARATADVEAVRLAVLRQQVAFWLDDYSRQSKTVVCLALEDGSARRSVSQEYLSLFPGETSVRVYDDCVERAAGAVERKTGRPAVLLSVGEISWQSDGEAWVTTKHYRSGLISATRKQRVVREEAGWVCLGQIIKDGPL